MAFALKCFRATKCALNRCASAHSLWPARQPSRNLAITWKHRKMNPHKSGFVSILGRPNAGKSTLLNALVGQKVAIVADKPQTTRTAIQGVVTLPGAQIVFVDTPGIHKADSQLNKRLMDTVRNELEERDLLLFLADAARKFGPEDRRAVDVARRIG